MFVTFLIVNMSNLFYFWHLTYGKIKVKLLKKLLILIFN